MGGIEKLLTSFGNADFALRILSWEATFPVWSNPFVAVLYFE